MTPNSRSPEIRPKSQSVSERLRSAIVSLLLIVSVVLAGSGVCVAKPLLIKGDGSTFAYPMYRKWIDDYQKQAPGVQFTYQSNGSSAGIEMSCSELLTSRVPMVP